MPGFLIVGREWISKEEEMFKSVGSFALIAFFAFAFSASAGAQANARRIGPAGPVARSAAAATQNADCQAPATVGEDYQGLSCSAVSAGAQADAKNTDPAGSATKKVDCQAPATVGEDYQGLSCEGTMVNLSAVPAPFFSIGEDFSGPEFISWPKGDSAVALRLEQVPERAAQAAPGSNQGRREVEGRAGKARPNLLCFFFAFCASIPCLVH
jgi:hypothetical protein